MKMKKILYSSLVVVISSMSFKPAIASGPPPDFSLAEKGAMCLAESIVSTVAALATFKGCAAAAGSYPVQLDTNVAGNGTATLDFDLKYKVTVTDKLVKGTQCKVSSTTTGLVSGVEIKDFNTLMWDDDPLSAFSARGEIYYATNVMTIADEPWDEHVIKDFWLHPKRVRGWAGKNKVIKNLGIEVITKNHFPRSKWIQASKYLRPDNIFTSRIEFKKKRIAPHGLPPCKIKFTGSVDNFVGFNLSGGSVTVEAP